VIKSFKNFSIKLPRVIYICEIDLVGWKKNSKLISRRSAKKITSVQLYQNSLGMPPICVMLASKDTPWILGKGSSQQARDTGVPVSRIVSWRGIGLVMRWGSQRGGGRRYISRSVDTTVRRSAIATCFAPCSVFLRSILQKRIRLENCFSSRIASVPNVPLAFRLVCSHNRDLILQFSHNFIKPAEWICDINFPWIITVT